MIFVTGTINGYSRTTSFTLTVVLSLCNLETSLLVVPDEIIDVYYTIGETDFENTFYFSDNVDD